MILLHSTRTSSNSTCTTSKKTTMCASVADDMRVFGRTAAEHDKKLIALMVATKEYKLVFSSATCKIRAKSISFGCTYRLPRISNLT